MSGPNTLTPTSSTCVVSASFASGTISKTFEVLEPAEVVGAVLLGTNAPHPVSGHVLDVNEVGVMIRNEPIVVGPTNVSFYRVTLFEGARSATDLNGYFVLVSPPSHNSNNGANRPPALDQSNRFADVAGFVGFPPPWMAGHSQWDIPVRWTVNDSGLTNAMTGWTQECDIDTEGSVTVTKFGFSATRETNGVVTVGTGD